MNNKGYTYSIHHHLLDALKGLTIIWICWYHIDQLMLPGINDTFNFHTLARFGYLGVTTFIILSGFGLTLSIRKNTVSNCNKFPWKEFFLRRVARIYPLYVFSHFIFLITGAIMGKYEDMPFNIGFILSITGLRAFFRDYFWYGPDTFWFIGLIIQLYILFPFLFMLIKITNTTNFLIIIFILTLISRNITCSFSDVDKYNFMLGLAPNRLAEFSLGIALANNILINQNPLSYNIYLKKSFIWKSFIMLTATVLFVNLQPYFFIRDVLLHPLLGIIVSLFNLIIIGLLTRKIKVLGIWMSFMGSISYSIYLWHSPPIRPAFAALTKIGINNYWLITILYLAVITLVSYSTTYLDNLINKKMRVSSHTTRE
jgi:peptidoglycan/LPS O-acetylase OafA/YrhL